MTASVPNDSRVAAGQSPLTMVPLMRGNEPPDLDFGADHLVFRRGQARARRDERDVRPPRRVLHVLALADFGATVNKTSRPDPCQALPVPREDVKPPRGAGRGRPHPAHAAVAAPNTSGRLDRRRRKGRGGDHRRRSGGAEAGQAPLPDQPMDPKARPGGPDRSGGRQKEHYDCNRDGCAPIGSARPAIAGWWTRRKPNAEKLDSLCDQVDILILRAEVTLPPACDGSIVLRQADFRRGGSAEVFATPTGWRIAWSQPGRGVRPWTVNGVGE